MTAAARWSPWLLVALLGALACAGRATVPPIMAPATSTHHPGKVVWHDLVTDDVDGARRFYSELFGWTFDGTRGNYTTIRSGGREVGGMIHAPERAKRSAYWIPSVSVSDVDEVSRAILAAGGQVIDDPTDLPDRGRVAVVTDDQGAPFAILRSSSGDPPDAEAPQNGWLWHEIVLEDPRKGASFYARTMGYRLEEVGARDYLVLEHAGVPRLGLVANPFEGSPSLWLPYLRVPDPAAIAARVEALGGNVVLAPDPALRQGTVALIQDPGGAPIAIQRWPIDGVAEVSR